MKPIRGMSHLEERKMAHTPGPWHLHDMEDATVVGPDHLAIADCNAKSRSLDTNEMNGRLIAAAPDLLAALVAIIEPDNERQIEFISKLQYYRAYIEAGELERARAAIAKARGQ